MNNVSLIYHYIRDDTRFAAMSTTDFRSQIEHIARKYEIISVDTLLNNAPAAPSCVLTFDDGIKDCLTNVLPILQEFGVSGTFFIPTMIFSERRLTQVQKRHVLLAELGTERFVDEFNKRAEDVFHITFGDDSYGFDDPLTANLKITLDTMDWQRSQEILQSIFDSIFDEATVFSQTHMCVDEIREVESAGMEIGAHGHAHRWFGRLYFQDMVTDLQRSVDTFETFLGRHPRIMSYPFGSYDRFTSRIASQLGFIAAMTTVKEKNTKLDKPMELARIDCVDVYPVRNSFGI